MRKLILLFISLAITFTLCGCDIVSELFDSEETEQEVSVLSGSLYDTLSFGGLEVTITSVQYSDHLGGLEGLMKASDGNTYCTVYMNVKNVSTVAVEPGDYHFSLMYNEVYSYNCSFDNYSQFFNAHGTINALEVLSDVCISFEVPLEVRDNIGASLSVRLSKNSVFEKDYAEWRVR